MAPNMEKQRILKQKLQSKHHVLPSHSTLEILARTERCLMLSYMHLTRLFNMLSKSVQVSYNCKKSGSSLIVKLLFSHFNQTILKQDKTESILLENQQSN